MRSPDAEKLQGKEIRKGWIGGMASWSLTSYAGCDHPPRLNDYSGLKKSTDKTRPTHANGACLPLEQLQE